MAATEPQESDGGSTVRAADETTPLLATIAAGPTAEPIEESPQADGVHQEDEDVPLPLDQIFLLCLSRLVEPIAFFSIFPYINKMIYETGGIEKSDVGFYSGLIESLFSATQMCVMIFWGWVSRHLFTRRYCTETNVGSRFLWTKAGIGLFAGWNFIFYSSIRDEQIDMANDSFPMPCRSICGDNRVSRDVFLDL